MKPEYCPRFDSCSAPLCPLDADWRRRRHLNGDRVCAYLLEATRHGGTLPNTLALAEGMAEAVAEAYPAIEASCGSLRSRLKRASQAGPRLGVAPVTRTTHREVVA